MLTDFFPSREVSDEHTPQWVCERASDEWIGQKDARETAESTEWLRPRLNPSFFSSKFNPWKRSKTSPSISSDSSPPSLSCKNIFFHLQPGAGRRATSITQNSKSPVLLSLAKPINASCQASDGLILALPSSRTSLRLCRISCRSLEEMPTGRRSG